MLYSKYETFIYVIGNKVKPGSDPLKKDYRKPFFR